MKMPNSRRVVTIVAAVGLIAGVGCRGAPEVAEAAPEAGGPSDQSAARPAGQTPSFTPAGELVRPEGWEAWVMVGASIGLSYNEPTSAPEPGEAPGRFHNVFMQPWAYRHFMDTGEFAEETMFVLAFYDASQDADPAAAGFYEGELSSTIEVHLKMRGLDESGWGFFGFSGDVASGEPFPADATCYTCHAERTEHDNVFVQFYPTLRTKLSGPSEE